MSMPLMPFLRHDLMARCVEARIYASKRKMLFEVACETEALSFDRYHPVHIATTDDRSTERVSMPLRLACLFFGTSYLMRRSVLMLFKITILCQ